MTRVAPHPDWIVPDWPAPAQVRAMITTRAGGVSRGPFGVPPSGEGGLNVGLKSGDDLGHVRANRDRLRAVLPSEPCWLHQVHGATVVPVDEIDVPVTADAATSMTPGRVCVVTVADCLPVILADLQGRVVGLAHSGWRGLAAGVLQETAKQMRLRLGKPDARLCAYLGPAIGPTRFEVGAEVRAAMHEHLPLAERAFVPVSPGKYLADLFSLARQALAQVGVTEVSGGGQCTASDPVHFYSFRRDRVTGRHAALVWIAP